MKGIAVDVVKEIRGKTCVYRLIKLSVGEKETFCIHIDGEEYACEGVGNDLDRSVEIFDVIVENQVSAIHIAEILYDIGTEIYR